MKLFGLDISRVSKREIEHVEPLVRERVQRLEIDFREISERLVTLEGHFNKLRGIVHGDRSQNAGRRAVRTVESIPFGDKRALRAAFGLTPRQEHDENNQE